MQEMGKNRVDNIYIYDSERGVVWMVVMRRPEIGADAKSHQSMTMACFAEYHGLKGHASKTNGAPKPS